MQHCEAGCAARECLFLLPLLLPTPAFYMRMRLAAWLRLRCVTIHSFIHSFIYLLAHDDDYCYYRTTCASVSLVVLAVHSNNL